MEWFMIEKENGGCVPCIAEIPESPAARDPMRDRRHAKKRNVGKYGFAREMIHKLSAKGSLLFFGTAFADMWA